jgi:hypothetical protein
MDKDDVKSVVENYLKSEEGRLLIMNLIAEEASDEAPIISSSQINQISQSRKSIPGKNTWKIDVDGNKVAFARLNNDRVIEAYAPVSLDKASIYAASIIHGYQPPRSLVCLDKPID